MARSRNECNTFDKSRNSCKKMRRNCKIKVIHALAWLWVVPGFEYSESGRSPWRHPSMHPDLHLPISLIFTLLFYNQDTKDALNKLSCGKSVIMKESYVARQSKTTMLLTMQPCVASALRHILSRNVLRS